MGIAPGTSTGRMHIAFAHSGDCRNEVAFVREWNNRCTELGLDRCLITEVTVCDNRYNVDAPHPISPESFKYKFIGREVSVFSATAIEGVGVKTLHVSTDRIETANDLVVAIDSGVRRQRIRALEIISYVDWKSGGKYSVCFTEPVGEYYPHSADYRASHDRNVITATAVKTVVAALIEELLKHPGVPLREIVEEVYNPEFTYRYSMDSDTPTVPKAVPRRTPQAEPPAAPKASGHKGDRKKTEKKKKKRFAGAFVDAQAADVSA